MRSFSSEYGGRADRFGHADYYEALKIGTPSEIVSYLSENQHLLGDRNRRNTGGLYDEIQREAERRNRGTINSLGGQSPYRFGGVDHRAALAAGFTDKQIKAYLDKNPDRLWAGNKPGVEGGLYERVLQGIKDNPDFLDRLQITVNEQKAQMQQMQDAFNTREEAHRRDLQNMINRQDQFDQAAQRREAARDRELAMTRRVTLANQERGGQQANFRLGGAAGAIRGGTAGFRRRPKRILPEISAAGFTSPGSSGSPTAKTLNV